MKALLTLRQNKIIQILRNSRTYLTSDEISKILNVSSKTVRTDIADINNNLFSEGIYIDSTKGRGFVLCVENPELLNKISKDNQVFLSQADRVYFIAERLCMASESINFYDLEEEISVSSSTLTGDLTAFKKRFVYGVPYIALNISKNELSLEDDERKRRFILTKLLSDNWDYNGTGNVYYDSSFLISDVFEKINSLTGAILCRNGIYMEDYSLISLNLYLSVTFYRLQNGCGLNVPLPEDPLPEKVLPVARELFSALEEKLDYHFPEEEMIEAAYIISETRIYNREDFYNNDTFPEKYHTLVSTYLDRIYDMYGLELRDNDEFYDRMLSFIMHMFRPMKDLTVRDTADHIKQHLFVEFDIAILFHKIAEDYFNITENDLLYLTWAISGSFFSYFARHPEERFDTVVLSHMSSHSMWALKAALVNQFGGYLNIKEVLPVYMKDYYDFSNVDLVLTTVDKKIAGLVASTLPITPYLSKEDSHAIVNYIRDLKIRKLYPKKVIPIAKLLDEAFIHENMEFSSQYSIIEYMAQDFIANDIYTPEHQFKILKRESISSFAINPALLLLYTTSPAKQTKLSVLTLKHRITWNKYKIRIVMMISLTEEDTNELIYLQNILFHRHFDPEKLKEIKTLEQLKEYYKDY